MSTLAAVVLPEFIIEVSDFHRDYQASFDELTGQISLFGRTDEHWTIATAKVHLVLSDPSITVIEPNAFEQCRYARLVIKNGEPDNYS
jgi:hypothetical protein